MANKITIHLRTVKIVVPIVAIPQPDMRVKLINAEGEPLNEGCIVHVTTGPSMGRAYRYEGVCAFGKTHRVKVSRKAIHGNFRAVEWLHPTMLGCKVECPRTRKQRCSDFLSLLWHKLDDWVMAGVVALVPLALFEHYHWAGKITEVVSLGLLGGGH